MKCELAELGFGIWKTASIHMQYKAYIHKCADEVWNDAVQAEFGTELGQPADQAMHHIELWTELA
jgi:hypothetical protein